jgi:hypothetical protein
VCGEVRLSKGGRPSLKVCLPLARGARLVDALQYMIDEATSFTFGCGRGVQSLCNKAKQSQGKGVAAALMAQVDSSPQHKATETY